MTQLFWFKNSHFNQSIICGIIAVTILFLVPVQNAASQQTSTSVTQSELAEGQTIVPCPLLVQLNIKGMTDEEVVAINKVWDMQPEWFHDYINEFFAENVGKFKGMEKEWVISLMNGLYVELNEESLVNKDWKNLSTEVKRGLTSEQRKQISQSEDEFIDWGITYAEKKGEEYDKSSAESRASSAETRNSSLNKFLQIYQAYQINPTASTLKDLKEIKDEMIKLWRDTTSISKELAVIDLEIEMNPDRVK